MNINKKLQTLFAVLSYVFAGIGLIGSAIFSFFTIADTVFAWTAIGLIFSFTVAIASYFITHHYILSDVKEELERIKIEEHIFSENEWNKIYDFLDEIERGYEEEDLRIITSYFIDWVTIQQPLKRLINKGVRIKIILMNPDNEELIKARFGIRTDTQTSEAVKPELRRQIKSLNEEPTLEKIDILVSDIMPSGFIVLSNKWILFGFMPAMGSYRQGPMVKANADSDLWKTFNADWERRWSQKK